MTETLKTLMERAAEIEFAAPDLDRITRDGGRTVRRRRAGVAVAAVAALGIVIGSGAMLVADGGDERGKDRGSVAAGPVDVPDTLSYARGQTLVTGSGRFKTGHEVRAYVRARNDYAFTDSEGTVFSLVGGKVERIGSVRADNPRLVGDPSGSLVAWVDEEGGAPKVVVYDLATGEASSLAGETGQELDLIGIDDSTVVWTDGTDELAAAVPGGTVQRLEHRPANQPLIAVGGGLRVYEGPEGALVGTSRDDVRLLDQAWGSSAVVSPSGRWVSVDADQPEVFDVTTGQRVAVDVGDHTFATGYEWLDEDSLAVLALEGDGEGEDPPFAILVCELPRGRCATAVTELATLQTFASQIAIAAGIDLAEDE